ncbi:hypothetical protein GCM10009804_20220 [Kribbella hippodromi]|uniref:Uncharacterized protein n=1 Tax=Kribbella hippodromi TaxID=434347 RepID=A0ABN2CUJ5_9ACTN
MDIAVPFPAGDRRAVVIRATYCPPVRAGPPKQPDQPKCTSGCPIDWPIRRLRRSGAARAAR